MPRTTVNIDAPVLRELRRLQKRERKSLGQLISDLLTEALRGRGEARAPREAFRWTARPMHARIDLADADALQSALDRDRDRGPER